MPKPIKEWRGTNEFIHLLDQMRETLAVKDQLTEKTALEQVAVHMANLQGMFDWYQIANEIELSGERIEAEFSRYEEAFEEVTIQQRQA